VTPGIIISLIALPIALVVGWRWYRRAIGHTTDDDRTISGIRLTAEALHRLDAPWRVVHEIGARLPGIDHVVVGPPGIIAIETRVGDRPPLERLAVDTTPTARAETALRRAPLDDLLTPVSMRTALLAHVCWGSAQPGRPAGDTVDGTAYVEGQRLSEWLDSLTDTTAVVLEAARIDAAWRVIVLGIGRPDPLT
jgi:hypothetical protein